MFEFGCSGLTSGYGVIDSVIGRVRVEAPALTHEFVAAARAHRNTGVAYVKMAGAPAAFILERGGKWTAAGAGEGLVTLEGYGWVVVGMAPAPSGGFVCSGPMPDGLVRLD